MLGLLLASPLLILLLFVSWHAVVYGIPVFNKLMSYIWEDPANRQRKVIVKRLKQMHVDGAVPAETAVMLAAAEKNTTSENLLGALDMFSSADLMGVLTGKRKPLSALLNGIEKTLKKGSGKRR